MASGSGLQRSRASSQASRAGPSRSSNRSNDLFRGNSPSSQETPVSSTQPATSRSALRRSASRDAHADTDREAAARKARRQKRREEQAYQVKGWEDLYGGGGGKPVFARDPLPARSTAPSSSRKDAATRGSSASKDRVFASQAQAQSSPSKSATSARRSTRSPSSSRLPPSTAPVSSRTTATESTTRLRKRKAPSPAPTSTSRAARTSPSKRKQPTVEEEDSDDGFEATAVSLASKRPRVDDDADASIITKASPSPAEARKFSRSTPTPSLRRSVSKTPVPSQRRTSPAPSLPIDHEHSPAAMVGLSPQRSPSRSSRASTSSQSSRDPDKLTPKQVEHMTRIANDAFAKGSSLADHIGIVVRAYAVNNHASQSEQSAVDELERKLNDIGPEASFNAVRTATQTTQNVPSGLRRRLALVFRTYASYLTRGHGSEQSATASVAVSGNNLPAAAAAQASISIDVASDVDANDTSAPQVTTELVEAESAPALAEAASQPEEMHVVDSATALNAEETSPKVPVADANADEDQMQIATPAEDEAQSNVAHVEDDELANAGHDSTVDSAGSPQAFGTPPEEPVEDPEEADRSSNEGDRLDESAQGPAEAEDSDQADELEEDELVDELVGEVGDVPHQGRQTPSHDEEPRDNQVADDHPTSAQPLAADDGDAAVDDQATAANEDTTADRPAGDQPSTAEEQVVLEERQAESQYEQQSEQQSEQHLDYQSEQQDEQHNGIASQGPDVEVEVQQAEQLQSQAPQPSTGSLPEDEAMNTTADNSESGANQVADQVATAVEQAERALADNTEAQQNQLVDAPAETPATVPVTHAHTNEGDQTPFEAIASVDTADGSRTAAAEDASVVPSATAAQSTISNIEPAALPAVTETGEQMLDAADPAAEASAATSSLAPVQTEAAEAVETSIEAPAVEASTESDPSEEARNLPMPAAAMSLATIPEAISSSHEAASASNTAPADEAGADNQQQESAQATDNAIEPATPPPAEAQAETASGPSREARNAERASSQAASESAMPAARRKGTIADRMKSLLKDLANVTNRKSSYDTIQKLKPIRKGASTERTVADLVERWQDPANMIPWMCLQEIGPGILHPRAERHMDLSMHELMDKVSNTRSVKYLTQKLPERVITRALMEFPRIPHMLHCWNNEKHKYFASRGLPQPMDTRPEFCFADAAEADPIATTASAAAATTPASTSRASAPPPITTSFIHLKIPEKKPQLARGEASASPMSAPATTQSHSVPPPSNSEIRCLHSPSPLTAIPVAPTANPLVVSNVALAPAAAQMIQSRQPNGGSANVAAQRQLLNNAGSLALVPHNQQSLQMLPASLPPAQPVQPLSTFEQQQRLLQQQQLMQSYRQFQPPPPPPPQQQQLTLHQAFQNQTNQPALQPPTPEAARLRRQQETVERQQRVQQLEQQQQQRQLQQQQQQQQSNSARIASAVRSAANAVFGGLVADCVSFAEHVLGSGAAADEIVSRDHFSESEVLHVVQYVLKVYKDEVDAERSAGRQNQQAEEKYAKILKVKEAALHVVSLTKTLLGIKMCVNEAVHDALRTQIGTTLPSVIHWQDLLSTAPKFKGIIEYLMRGEPVVLHRLSLPERRMLLHAKVVAVNRDLESTLEKMVGIDDLVGIGPAASGDNAEGEDDETVIRRECEMIAGICCKHVVGILGE